jgi:hypothetical protein
LSRFTLSMAALRCRAISSAVGVSTMSVILISFR